MPIKVNAPVESPFDEVKELGVVIKSFGKDSHHIGILYKCGEGRASICHLAWHMRLLNEAPDNSYAWVQSGLDETNRQAISAAVAAMAERGDAMISYSTLYEGIYFEEGTLRYVRGKLADGLTCATFVMAVFATFGIDLLDCATWQHRAADDEWQRNIIETLERWSRERGLTDVAPHVEAIRQHPLGVRYRPAEVVAAVGSTDPPIDFERAKQLASEVLAALHA